VDSNFISEAFRHYFEVVFADTDTLREQVFRLRYAVYCAELGWENPANFPDGLEQDAYDSFALHCVLRHRPTDRLAGTVRLIPADPRDAGAPLPFEAACRGHLDTKLIQAAVPDRRRTGEISRLAVLSDFRRRPGEQGRPAPLLEEADFSGEERRVFPHLALGLYLAAASMGLLAGLDSVFVMMEERLARRLKHYGIIFEQVGDAIDYHGRRGPYQITREMLYSHIAPPIESLLGVITQDLMRSHRFSDPRRRSSAL
jgi:N-acyl amino acid synthase of PEP-CTERM/exosortase system